MNPYHRYDDPLERARAEAGDKQKDTMLKAFRGQIVDLAAVLEPGEKKGRMSRLVEEWVPALEEIGVVSRNARWNGRPSTDVTLGPWTPRKCSSQDTGKK